MNFRDLLRKLSIPTAPEGHHHARSGWINFDCPFCSPGTSRWRMGYNVTGGYCNCWVCGPHNAGAALAAASRRPASETKRLLADVPKEKAGEVKADRGKLVLPDGLGDLLPAHERYLEKRGYDVAEVVRLWGVKGIGIAAKLQWRIWLPFVHQGEIVSWSTRAIVDGKAAKYVSAKPEQEQRAMSEVLYGEDYCRHAIIAHEGPLDVWKTGPGAVAVFGLRVSRAQINRLSRYPIRVVCFDSEPDAQKRARKLSDALEVFPGETYNVTLDAKDAGEASPREIRRLRKFLS